MNEYMGDSNVNLMGQIRSYIFRPHLTKRPEDEDAEGMTEEELEQLKEDLEKDIEEEDKKE